eukprot:symbB.v1.2.032922.t1/scaffold3979.1/size87083/2
MAAQSTLKRPAAGGGGGGQASKKRPAASTMRSTLDELRQGTKKDDAQENHDDDDDDDGEGDDGGDGHRDKGKGLKFAQMKSKLPPHIVELYDTVALEKTSPRAFRTMIVNQLFKKTESGRYILQDQKPLFQEAKRIYERKYGAEKQNSYPKSVLRGLYFGNCEKAFQEAAASGDIFPVQSADGKEFWAFQSEEIGRERQVDSCWHVQV